ncbi:MAG: fatty acid desaturase [Pseudomonadota bacterium]
MKNGSGIEWRTLFLLFVCMIAWFAAGLMWQTDFWWISLVVFPYTVAFHTSLQHETIHGHPTGWSWFNELLVSLPLVLLFPYRRYRALHLQHHNDLNLTDPYEDPESYFWPESMVVRRSWIWRTIFRWNNTLAGRLVIGPALSIVGFVRTEALRIWRGEPGVRLAWLLHGAGAAFVVWIVLYLFEMPLWTYLAIAVYPALSLTSLRSYAEHQAAENVGARSAIVETNVLFSLLFLNNNLHIVHHANPHVAWYDLPELYRERRRQFLAANDHTLFDGYGDIARRFAFRVKQPVDHPFLARDSSMLVQSEQKV